MSIKKVETLPIQIYADIGKDEKLSLKAKGFALMVISAMDDECVDYFSDEKYKSEIDELENNSYLHIIYCIVKENNEEIVDILLNGKKITSEQIKTHILKAENSEEYSRIKYKKGV